MEKELMETSVSDEGVIVEQSIVENESVSATTRGSPIPIIPKDVLSGDSREELESGDITSEQKNREEAVAVDSGGESRSNLGVEEKEKSTSSSSSTSESDQKKDSRRNLNSDVERSSISGGGGDSSDSSSFTNGDVRKPLSGSILSSPKGQRYLFPDEMKFMTNFDPAQRLERKRMKKYTHEGIIVERCDCLIPTCPGCHYPCNSCGSRYCGHVCRFERTWNYEEIEVEGRGVIRKWSGL